MSIETGSYFPINAIKLQIFSLHNFLYINYAHKIYIFKQFRAVVQEPPSQRRRGSSNTPLAIEVEKQRQKQHIMAPLAPLQPIATTEAEKARELAALKESLKELQFTDGMANLIGDRR